MVHMKTFNKNVIKNLVNHFKPGILSKAGGLQKDFTVIEMSAQGFAVAEVTIGQQKPLLKNCHFIYNENIKIRSELMVELFERRKINTAQSFLVLSPQYYKLLLAEAPPIPLEDLRVVMPAKIKDSIPWELTDSTSDVMPLPDDAFRGRKKSVYVASAQTSVIAQQVEMLRGIGIKPISISIAEIALLGFESLMLHQPKESYGVLKLGDTEGLINMVCDGNVYLSRRLNVALNDLVKQEIERQVFFDQLVLEIQRSVDFYESQMGKGPVAKIQLLPTAVELGVGYEYVEENISTDIEWFDPFELVEIGVEVQHKDKAHCTSAFGSAMRVLLHG